MCIAREELEPIIQEIRKYKTIAEEATNMQKVLEAQVISYMNENGLTETFTDSSKITWKQRERRTLDKEKLAQELGDLTEFEKVTVFNVLNIK